MKPSPSPAASAHTQNTRREFLADVGRGMLIATVGSTVATDLGLASALASEPTATTSSNALHFGDIEPLVCLMQETPADQLLPKLTAELNNGADVKRLVQAAAFANARTFGGEDYVGFHTMMALAPALHMAYELPKEQQALPVFKVLYRNTNRIQERGGRKNEILRPINLRPSSGLPAIIEKTELSGPQPWQERIRLHVRNKEITEAEQDLAALAQQSPELAFNYLLHAVHDHTEVHRVVMPYRAWDLLGLIGKEQAANILRQSIHYCVQAENWAQTAKDTEPATLLPKLLDEHKLLTRLPGNRQPDDAWVDQLSQNIFSSKPDQAAATVAAALAEGFAPDAIGEAITLAANQLVLRDFGRRPAEEVAGKPIGSVHGDSIGVHASDSANAWRNMARVSNPRNTFASLILGAYQLALDRAQRGGDFLNWQPLPHERYLREIRTTDPKELLTQLDESIRGNLQARATALVQKYSEQPNVSARPIFDLLLKYAISEDGALHAEKFYRTVTEEFNTTRPAYRWRHLIALARVTASEYGRPAAGMSEARSLLKV